MEQTEQEMINKIVYHNHSEIHGRIYWYIMAMEQRILELEKKVDK